MPKSTHRCPGIESDSEIRPIRDPVTGADSGANNTTYWVTGHGEHDGGDQSARKLYASGRIRSPNSADFRVADSTHRTSVTPDFYDRFGFPDFFVPKSVVSGGLLLIPVEF